MIRILLIEDEQLVREGMREILESHDDITVVGELDSGEYVLRAVDSLAPDIVLMDLAMPRVDGLQALADLQLAERPTASIVLTTFDADLNVLAALQRGAVGFLRKSVATEILVTTVRSAASGISILPIEILRTLIPRIADARGYHDDSLADLSIREHQIAHGVADGADNARIAAEMFLSETTVRSAISRLLRRLGVENRVQLAKMIWDSVHRTL